ncbi:MAG: efflux RND transporter periplasmic adaptor subunit, partial [Rugosibacter sp.]|nr:efflux RND transporter periplasmic adaptor subunit [Rugosibacter sp.]
MTKKKAAGIVLLGVIILASYLFNQDILIAWLDARNPSPKITASSLSGINETQQENIWVCPMHPEVMQSHPGTCPICGMDLVESGKHAAHDLGIHVDSASIQKLGVRLASVRKIHLGEEVRTYGNVTVDESTLYNVHTKFEGWIRKSHIHSVGQKIRKGQVIYEIYSPDLIAQQKEYLRFMVRRNQILQTIGDISLRENEYVMDLL